MPEPVYENDLVLASTFIKRDDMSREAVVTIACNDAGANKSAQEWADRIQLIFSNAFKAQLDTSAQIMRTTTLKGDGTSTFTVGTSTAVPVRGTNSMSSLPPTCAILLKKTTAAGGRKNRGRMYLPFMLNEGTVDETGAIQASVVTDVQSDCDDYMSDLTGFGSGSGPVIANRVFDLPWDNPGRRLVEVNIGEAITGLTCETMMATQRRRMPRS